MLPNQDEINESISSEQDNSFSVLDVDAIPDTGGDPDELKDSLLAAMLAKNLKDVIAFDEVAAEWYRCSNGIWKPISKIRATKIINKNLHGLLLEGFAMSKLNAVEGFLKLYLSLELWEPDKMLLPLKNGILDARNLELMPYTSDHKFNWKLPYHYDPDAKINVIKQWLRDVTSNDDEVISIIRAFFRVTLLGAGNVQKFLEIVGPGGTGKSTLIRLLIMLVGESNHAATDLKNLEQNRFEAATLYGKRLAVISDSSRYGGEVSVLKALTGGDPIRHERKNQQQGGSFVFGGTVVIASNEAIQSSDYSSGLARRRLPVNFIKKITDEDKAKWRAVGGIEKAMQAELSGLLNWVLSMDENEFYAVLNSITGEMNKSQRLHLVETNKLAAWIDDALIEDAGSILYIGGTSKNADLFEKSFDANNKLYPNYLSWCETNGIQPLAVQRFGNNLLDVAEHCKLNVTPGQRDSTGRKIVGLRIRRTKTDDHIATPITRTVFSVDQCQSNAEGTPPAGRASARSVGNVDTNLFEDAEVF